MSKTIFIDFNAINELDTYINFIIDGVSYGSPNPYIFPIDVPPQVDIIFAYNQTPVARFISGENSVDIDYSGALSLGNNVFTNPQVSNFSTTFLNLTTYNYSTSETPSYNAPLTTQYPNYTTINTTFEINSPCLHPDTIIDTPNGPIKISEIRSSNKLLDHNNQPVDLLFNIKFSIKDEFISIQKDALGLNVPNKELLICKNHPIFINGKEVQPTDLINGDDIKIVYLDSPVNVYSLCTQERIFVMMQGIPVCTWSKDDFEKEIVGKFYFEKL